MFPENKIVALCDFETTGLSPVTDYPIEVAILFLNHRLEILRSVDYLIRPDQLDVEESLDALMVNKITPEMLETEGQDAACVASEISVICEKLSRGGKKDIVICSDNAPFDRGFMKRLFELGEADWPFHYNSYDTDLLLEATGVGDPKPGHRAMVDVGRIYLALLEAKRRILCA